MKKQKRKRACKGETIVEVTASMLIFLLMVAMLQGAVAFCSKAQQKSRQIRYDAAEVSKAMRRENWPQTTQGTEHFQFYAVGADGTKGNNVFSMDVDLDTKDVTYESMDGVDKSMRFYIYDAHTGGGGGS